MKQNMIIKAAVAALFGAVGVSANAGIANGVAVTMATQAVVSNATALSTGSVTYSTQSPIALGSAFIYVKLSGGAKFVQTAAGTVVAASLAFANGGATAVVTVGTGTVSTDQTYLIYPITVSAAALPVNATFTFKPISVTAADAGVTNAGFLSTAASKLQVTTSIGSTSSATTVQTNIDTAATGDAIISQSGVTYLALQSGASNFASTASSGMTGSAVEQKQINVTSSTGLALINGATGTGTSNTAGTTLINFGGFKYTNASGSVAADGTTAFNMATNYAGGTSTLGAVATGNFGAAIGTGGKVFLSAASDCTTTLQAGTVNAGGTTATFSAVVSPLTAVASFLCMQVNTPSNAITIPATQPTIVTTLTGTSAATSTITSSADALYSLANNGASVDVRTYVPAAGAGYTSFIRVINTGSVAAQINAAVIDQTTGVVGTAGVLTSSLAAGGASTYTSTQVEAAVGALSGTSRPRIRITANTTLSVQSFILTNANGNYSVAHGAD